MSFLTELPTCSPTPTNRNPGFRLLPNVDNLRINAVSAETFSDQVSVISLMSLPVVDYD